MNTELLAPIRKRVLVVDDELDITALLKLLLEDAGFEVEESNGGRDAIEVTTGADRHEFDVVLLDITMPEVDGIDVARSIRECEACHRTRIAFHTAMYRDWIEVQFADFDDLLPKPMTVEVLVKRVCRLAETPRV